MRFLRVGICTLVAFSVAAHGGVEDWARAVLETGAGFLLVFWTARFCFYNHDEEKKIVVTPLLLPLIGLVLLALAQLLFRATASAYDSRMELTLLIADCILLFLAAQVFRTSDGWRTFVWFIMGFGFLVSIFGILQQLTFNGKLYWFREMRYGGIPFGPYVNRNHFAGFVELVFPVALVPLVLGKVRKERWIVVAIFGLLPIGALFLSASRGGVISFGVQLAVMILVMILRRTGGKHVLAGGMVLMLAFLLVSWLGVRQVMDRFSSLQSLEVTTGKRTSMRHDTWGVFLDHPWTGTGLGTLPIVFPAYETLYDGRFVNHAHNDYLEALADTGLVGGACCTAFLGILFFLSLRQLLRSDKAFAAALHLSGLISCVGILVHSFVDFNLHIPSNALLFLLMAHLATGEIISTARENPPPHLQT